MGNLCLSVAILDKPIKVPNSYHISSMNEKLIPLCFREARISFVFVHCVLIQACFIAVHFVQAMDRKLPSVLAVQRCLDIRAVDMDILVIPVEGIGHVVAVI